LERHERSNPDIHPASLALAPVQSSIAYTSCAALASATIQDDPHVNPVTKLTAEFLVAV
jgi:hypothetical protein